MQNSEGVAVSEEALEVLGKWTKAPQKSYKRSSDREVPLKKKKKSSFRK